MKILHDEKNFIKSGVVLSFGNFDGIHIGHATVFKKLKEISKNKGIPSAILTFEPHPLVFLKNKKNFMLLDFKQKIDLISQFDIDYLYIITFDEKFSKLSPHDFIKKILVDSYNIKCIVVGYECIFGYKAEGNLTTLREYSNDYGYDIVSNPAISLNGVKCSSSLIRSYLKSGEIDLANSLLNRYYQIRGKVLRGSGRGKTIGFPTINVDLDVIVPKLGVYYAQVIIDNEILHGVANIGIRPTFGDIFKPILEMYIFNFNRDIYDEEVKINLIKFIRSEQKFANIEELKKQIGNDLLTVNNIMRSMK